MFIPRRDPKDGPKIIIFSGAGLDAPSGVQTFRDTDGLWNEHKIEDVCTQSTWKKNHDLVHDFYNQRRRELKDVEPNHAHKVIKEITDLYPGDVINVTMNVSDLLERSGVECLHVHGELKRMECEKCGNKWDIGYEEWNGGSCPNCNDENTIRPGIVFFGGSAPMYSYMWRAFEHTMNKDSIIIIIGTQGNVVNVEENLVGTPCKKILCNMEPSRDINVKKIGFDKVYYESIETAIDKIKQDVIYWRK